MEELDQNELLAYLEGFEAVYLEACRIAKTYKILAPGVEQACKQIKELIQKSKVTEKRIEKALDEAISVIRSYQLDIEIGKLKIKGG